MSDTRFTLNAQLSGQRLSISLPLTVSGTVNYLDVVAKGNDSWNNCAVTCYLVNEKGDVTRLGLEYSYAVDGYVYPSDNRFTLSAGQWSVWFSGVRTAGSVVTYRIVSEIKNFIIKANDFYSSAETNPPQLSEQAYALANTAYQLANALDNAWKAGDLTGEQGVPGVPADIGEVTATVDNNVGTPSCDVTVTKNPDEENSYNMDFDFKNLKGEQGNRGYKAVIDDVGVAVSQTTGVPSASATITETQGDNNYRIDFEFDGIKGETGDTIDDYVLVQPTQPTSQTNKIWVDSDDDPITLPTPDDFDYYDIVQNFDATKNYSAGDYVTHEGGVYVFNVNHSAGAWNGSEVTQTVLGNEVTNLKSALNNFTGCEYHDFSSGYIRLDQGTTDYTVTPEAGFAHALVDVSQVKYVYIKTVGGKRARAYGFINSSDSIIDVADEYATLDELMTVPENAVYLIVNTTDTGASFVRTGISLPELNNQFNEFIADTEQRFDNISTQEITEIEYSVLNMYISSNKLRNNTESNVGKTIAFPVENGKKYIINAIGAFNRAIVRGCNSITAGSAATSLYSGGTSAYTNLSYEYISDGTYAYIVICVAYNYDSYVLTSCSIEAQKGYDQQLKIMGVPVATMDDVANSIDASFDGYVSKSNVENVATATALYALYDALVTAHHDYVTKDKLGEDEWGNDINEYTFTTGAYNYKGQSGQRPKDAVIAKPKILILTGVHGNERCSVMGTYQFAKDLCEGNQGLYALRGNTMIKIVPLMNPSGFISDTRFNDNGVNLNLNFTRYWTETDPSSYNDYGGAAAADQYETQIIEAWMNANNDATYFIDYHNSGYASEVSYLAGEDIANDKKIYLEAISSYEGYLIDKENFDPNMIYCYTGNFNHSAMSYYQAQYEGISSSMCLEASYNINSTGRNSALTIKTNGEVIGNMLTKFMEQYST